MQEKTICEKKTKKNKIVYSKIVAKPHKMGNTARYLNIDQSRDKNTIAKQGYNSEQKYFLFSIVCFRQEQN